MSARHNRKIRQRVALMRRTRDTAVVQLLRMLKKHGIRSAAEIHTKRYSRGEVWDYVCKWDNR